MATPTYTSPLTIDELEASYPTYCKALRILVRDGVSEIKACCLPRQYRDPQQLFFLLRREHNAMLSGSEQ
jgi:hypothetical protein